MKIINSLLLIAFIVGLNFLPAFANCADATQNADLDTQCNTTQCGGAADNVKGCYLPPEAGAACPENYPNQTSDGICCCAS